MVILLQKIAKCVTIAFDVLGMAPMCQATNRPQETDPRTFQARTATCCRTCSSYGLPEFAFEKCLVEPIEAVYHKVAGMIATQKIEYDLRNRVIVGVE
jgi:hypothetical protein